MRKWLYLSLVVVPLLIMGAVFPVFAQPAAGAFVQCSDTPEYCQTKVAQVAMPWQFWAVGTDTAGATTVIDRIRISPTWRLNPPVGQPAGEGDVFVRRQWTISPAWIPLNQLVWDFNTTSPLSEDLNRKLGLDWEQPDTNLPAQVGEDEDLELFINVGTNDAAVLVAYEVMVGANGTGPAVAHFINEATLRPVLDPAPGEPVVEIVEVRVNFDIHNDTEFEVTNFELDFLGVNFTCQNITWALGFIAANGTPPVPVPWEPWGANEDNPLVVRPIEVELEDGDVVTGTEVKWIQPDRPLVPCEWLHGGLSFTLDDLVEGVNATVQGYWTVIVPCEGRMTGGGSVFTEDGTRVTHGFELHCYANQAPNNLEVNWGKGKKGANRFHLTELTWARCLDSPLIDEAPPVAGFDTYIGFGKGRYNGVDGATILFAFTDEGEPGKNDRATMMIRDVDGNVVLMVPVVKLQNGNHQAHAQ